MKKTYNVTVERGKKMWVLVCPDIHLVSQCRTLGGIEKEMIPLIAEIEELPEESIELDVQYILPQEYLVHEEKSRTLRNEATQAEREATREASLAARTLVDSGITLRDAGRIMGLTHQRISQLAHA